MMVLTIIDSNGSSNSPTVPNIPAIETNQSLVVPVDIHPESTSDTDNEHSNNNESANPRSTVPAEALHSTTVDSKINCVDAEQKAVNENVALIVAVQTRRPNLLKSKGGLMNCDIDKCFIKHACMIVLVIN